MNIVEFCKEYKDVITIGFSTLAFIISSISLSLSMRNTFLDRVQLKISARLVEEPMWNSLVRIDVTVLNVGRRNAVLEGLLMRYEKGNTKHDYKKNGLVLKEKERIILSVERNDLILNLDEGEIDELFDVSILDIESKEFKIPNSKQLVDRFHNQNGIK